MTRDDRLSKTLSYVLRHRPDTFGLKPDAAGWVPVAELLSALSRQGRPVSRDAVEQVVRDSDKQRFALSEDGSRIRANEGHSMQVELGYEACEPPAVLYHGTLKRSVASIREHGLEKRQRHHVHLSAAPDTASSVGARRGRPIVLQIEASLMHAEGHAFFRSANGVWLTEHVPAKYIRFPEE